MTFTVHLQPLYQNVLGSNPIQKEILCLQKLKVHNDR